MTLNDCRYKIDELNIDILKLLNKRALLALEIGKLKNLDGIPIYNPIREEQILEEIQTKNRGPLGNGSIRRIFNTIMEECRNLQADKNLTEMED